MAQVYPSTAAQYECRAFSDLEAACFDPKLTKKGESKIATGHFFRLNLRFDHLDHLNLSRPVDGKKKDHDMTIIKRAGIAKLRNGAQTGRKMRTAWDEACLDYWYWNTLKRRGIYLVTEEKSNSTAKQISTDITDRRDPRNEGIVSDCFVGRSNRPQLRRMIYTDPRDGTMKSLGNFINNAVQRATQWTHLFIRWLRVALYREIP